MKGLVEIPSLSDSQYAYQQLQTRAEAITVAQLALWTQWARLDPRLAEQWIVHVSKFWKSYSAIEWNLSLRSQPWPCAAGPLFEQVRSLLLRDRAEKNLFSKWFQCVMRKIDPASGEQYFVGLRAFGGALMQKDAAQTLLPYQRWGYCGREILVNKSTSKTFPTLSPAEIRKRILTELIEKGNSIRTQDYLDALGGAMSRRQAELDLQHHPNLKSFGNTQAKTYRKK